MSVVDNARAPHVEFFFRQIEDRNASLENGHYTTRDVAFIRVTRPGSRDNLEKEAEVWLKEIAEKAKAGAVPDTWADGFRRIYDKWLAGETSAVNGTPIKGWPVIGPSAQEAIIRAGFLSVEDLAGAGDNEVSHIGTGAITYKQKAIAWLEAANGPGKLTEKMVNLQSQLEAVLEANKNLMEANKELQAQVKALTALEKK